MKNFRGGLYELIFSKLMNETGIEDLDNTNQPAEMKFDSQRLLRLFMCPQLPKVIPEYYFKYPRSRWRPFYEDNGQWIFKKKSVDNLSLGGVISRIEKVRRKIKFHPT